jgi:HEAT repeat protein
LELQKKFESYLQTSKNKATEERQNVYSVAMALRGSAGLSFIQKAKNDPDPDTRISMLSSILENLNLEKSPYSSEQKAQMLSIYANLKSDKDSRVRSIAARSCAGLGSDCLPIIKPFLKDKDPRVREAALNQELHTLGKDIIPLVKPLLKDPNRDVASAAKKILEMIQEGQE